MRSAPDELGCCSIICELIMNTINSLKDRRDKLFRSFFQKMSNPASCLHHLLPPRRNTSVTSRLRSCTPLSRPTPRTKKFQSFVNFALRLLSKYQSPIIPSITPVVSLFSHYRILLLPFALMYFAALMDCVILYLRTVLLLLWHCLHCTVIQLFGYLHSRKCAK